jgi:hypothetical protein
MSYDTIKSRNRRAGKNWGVQSPSQGELLEDVARGNFLRQLDRADIEVTDFEADFIESFLSNKSLNWWTPGRRATCDKMRHTYGGGI